MLEIELHEEDGTILLPHVTQATGHAATSRKRAAAPSINDRWLSILSKCCDLLAEMANHHQKRHSAFAQLLCERMSMLPREVARRLENEILAKIDSALAELDGSSAVGAG